MCYNATTKQCYQRIKEMKKMDALKFYKEHEEYCEPDAESGMVQIELRDIVEIMEAYHQSKVNNVVLPAVIKCECKYNQGIISVCKSCIDSADVFAA